MGVRTGNRITSANILDYIENSPEVDLLEYKVIHKDLTGKTLLELALRKRFGVSVIATRRGEDVIVSPSAQEKLLEGDVIFIIGKTENSFAFKEALEK